MEYVQIYNAYIDYKAKIILIEFPAFESKVIVLSYLISFVNSTHPLVIGDDLCGSWYLPSGGITLHPPDNTFLPRLDVCEHGHRLVVQPDGCSQLATLPHTPEVVTHIQKNAFHIRVSICLLHMNVVCTITTV